MTTFTLPYGRLDVEGSINYFINANLLTSVPKWMGQVKINFDYPNKPLVFPCFSVSHFDAIENTPNRHQGDNADGGSKGIPYQSSFEVSCWIDSTTDQNYAYYLRTMVDMVDSLFRKNPAFPILNVYSGTVPTPSATGAIIRVSSVKQSQAPAVLNNPAVKRVRVVVNYFYELRW